MLLFIYPGFKERFFLRYRPKSRKIEAFPPTFFQYNASPPGPRNIKRRRPAIGQSPPWGQYILRLRSSASAAPRIRSVPRAANRSAPGPPVLGSS